MPMTEAVAKMVGRFERMERADQDAFYREIASHFITTTGIFEVRTSNFDEMASFFRNLDMEVSEEKGDQLLHLFGEGRVVSIRRGDILFHLRQSASEHRTPFNLYLDGYSPAAVERLRHIGYDFREHSGRLGSFFQFTSPDGGMILIAP